MIARNSYCFKSRRIKRDDVINNLLQSRNLFNVQTIEYDLTAVCSLDLDPTGNFLLVGLSNGTIDLQGIQDLNLGILDPVGRLALSPFSLHRVQWNPSTDEQFLSILDNHTLYLVDPVEMRPIDKFLFNLKTNWSEWNPNDRKIIAVCANESQVRLVDIRSGSSVQSIVLEAKSGLGSHRATRCLWSKYDCSCLIVGDNEGFLHVYDTRRSSKHQLMVGEEFGQISGMSFTNDNNSVITSQGTENHLIQWSFDRCSLTPQSAKFKKVKEESIGSRTNGCDTTTNQSSTCNNSIYVEPCGSRTKRQRINEGKLKKSQEKRRHINSISVDTYLRCQFYITDRHVFCPVPNRVKKSKELYVYDLDTGNRIKTLKSDGIMSQGVYAITGLLPDSLALYVGGRNRLRLWTIDEDHQAKMEEKIMRFHTTSWDSD